MQVSNVYIIEFLLTRWEWNPKKITGFIPDIVRMLWEYLDNYLQTGNFPSKSEWKREVVDSFKSREWEMGKEN